MSGLKRNGLDKYYTKEYVVNECINLFKKKISINKKNDLIIEPSAGDGSFISYIKKISNNYIFYDIEPENDEITKQDYLTLDTKELKNKYKKIHVVGNPPFGRQSSLAIKFIKKSCEYCDTLSFILPKSFKKESLRKNIDEYFHLIEEIDLPEKSFLLNNTEHDVPCIFQIWKRENNKREIVEKLQPINFIFVDKNNNPDISFRRVGINAGKIDTNTEDKNIQSHYFIKFINDKNITEILEKLKNIVYEFNNTVGPKSISKQELIYKFNPILQ